MTNIFNIVDNANLVRRLESLNADSKHLWGKMTVGQMVKHCQKPLDVAEGTLVLKRGLIGWLFGNWAKNDFIKRDEFKKNLPTAPSFKIDDDQDFERERDILLKQVIRFRETGPAIIANRKHPFFGEMSDDEWGVLAYKHLDHHLRQFGV